MLDGRRRACGESNSEDSEARRVGEDGDVEAEEPVDEEEADTDLETDRLLGQQRTDDQGFYDDKVKRSIEYNIEEVIRCDIHKPSFALDLNTRMGKIIVIIIF